MEECKIVTIEEFLNKNICSNCSKQLNVSPIYCTEKNHQKEKICGRCVKIINGYSNKTKKCRQYLFEDFCKCINFPCSNKKFGCGVELSWDNVQSHEKMCTFQGTKCPLAQRDIFPNETCNWEGNIVTLHEHIETSHKPHILNPPQLNWIDNKQNMIFFTNVSNQIITVIIKYKEESESIYHCLLMVNGTDVESQCYRYQLELFDETKDNSIILRRARLEPLVFMVDNLNKYDNMLEVDVAKIRQMMKNTTNIFCRFGIVKKPKKEIASIMGMPKSHESLTVPLTKPKDCNVIDEKMLLELECPVCKDLMVPPIFICKTGHSVCSSCKPKIPSCPNCRDGFSGARNFTLEKLTEKVNYPCRNRDLGCTFVTTSDKITAHQTICELSEIECLLKCGKQDLLSNMFNHLKLVHTDTLIEVDILQIADVHNNEVFHFFQAHNILFRISIKKASKDAFQFNVQQVYLGEGEPKFRYQLQFIDHTPLGLNSSFIRVCRQLTHLATAHSTGITIPWNLLKSYIFEYHYFYYKVSIMKI